MSPRTHIGASTGGHSKRTSHSPIPSPHLRPEGTPTFKAAAGKAGRLSADNSDALPPAVSPAAAPSSASARSSALAVVSDVALSAATAGSTRAAAVSSSGPGGAATSIANAADVHLPAAALPASSGPVSPSPVGDVAPRDEGRKGKNAEPIGDLSTAYDEPRSNFHAACPFDCPWEREDVPRGDFFRGSR